MSQFLNRAIDFIRERCAATRADKDGALLSLAAHLFAIAESVPIHEGAAALADSNAKDPPFDSPAKILMEFRALQPPMAAQELYWRLVAALICLDRHLSRSREFDLPSWRTRLAEDCPINGEVVHWLRPASGTWMSKTRHSRRSQLMHGPQNSSPHPADCLGRLAMYWNTSRAPQLRPWREPFRRLPLIRDSGDDASNGGFRIALCPLLEGVHPQFLVKDSGRLFHALGPDCLVAKERLFPHLEELLITAASREIHLLALPELMIDREALHHLTTLLKARQNDLAPYGVIAGSFHSWPGEVAPGGSSFPANESLLLASNGQTLLKHQKRGKFRLSPQAVLQDEKTFPRRPEPFPKGIEEVVEAIQHEPEVEILETTLGRLAIVICADCIAPDYTNLKPFLMQIRPDLLIIVSMSPTTAPFVSTMDELAERGISSFFVNARQICKPGQLLAAAHLGIVEPAGAPPTRVRWRKGEPMPEVHHFGPDKEWQPISGSQDNPSHGVSWLGSNGHPLGLALDLGVHGS